MQYLFALAVAEACEDEGVLGRHGRKVSWPKALPYSPSIACPCPVFRLASGLWPVGPPLKSVQHARERSARTRAISTNERDQRERGRSAQTREISANESDEHERERSTRTRESQTHPHPQVRIKWPNDVYAEVGYDDKSGLGYDDKGQKQTKKIGGILVNTGFNGPNADVIIGESVWRLSVLKQGGCVSLSRGAVCPQAGGLVVLKQSGCLSSSRRVS